MVGQAKSYLELAVVDKKLKVKVQLTKSFSGLMFSETETDPASTAFAVVTALTVSGCSWPSPTST